MAKRTPVPSLNLDLLRGYWWSGSKPLKRYGGDATNTITVTVLPDNYQVYRMDLYLWSNANNLPSLSYQASWFRDAAYDATHTAFQGQITVSHNISSLQEKTTIPVVYYIDRVGSIVHIAYGGLVSGFTGGDTTTNPGGGLDEDFDRCFPLDTPILFDGAAKVLGAVGKGDEVLGVNHKTDNSLVDNKVLRTFFHAPEKKGRECFKFRFEAPRPAEFISTDTHPILTENGFTHARKIKAGEYIMSAIHGACKVAEVIPVKWYRKVGTLETTSHNYTITELGLIVHNISCDRPGSNCDTSWL